MCSGPQSFQRVLRVVVVVVAVAVVVMEMEGGFPSQKTLAHAGLTSDPERLVTPVRSLPPSILSASLHLSSTSVPPLPLWGSSFAHMEVRSSSWSPAREKGRGGRGGADGGRKEGSIGKKRKN